MDLIPENDQMLFNAVFQSAVDGIITIDAKGFIQMVNPAAAALFGYSLPEIKGKNISMLMPEPHQSLHDHYIHRYKQTGKAHIIGVGRDVEGRRKDGTTFPFRLSISEFTNNGEKYFAGIVHDLSLQKANERKIKALNIELEHRKNQLENQVSERTEKLAEVVNKLLATNHQLQVEIKERELAEKALREHEGVLQRALDREKELGELKSRFVSLASHEFRTPLSTVLTSASLIGRYTEGGSLPQVEKHVHRIKNAVKHLNEILNDFLSIGKLEEGKIQANPEDVCALAIVSRTSEELRLILKNGQSIQVDCDKNSIPGFMDGKLFRNIVTNLLSNAIKYSPERKPIRIGLQVEDDNLLMEVEDQGYGIPEADQAHLFSAFFRASNTQSIDGIGLGLNIVKRYTDLMGGQIKFKSREDKGTTFYVQLPLRQTDQQPPKNKKGSDQERPLQEN